MAGVDQTSFAYALKTLYPDGIAVEAYRDNPAVALVPKDTDFEGDVRVIAVQYADNKARSASFSTAQTKAASSGHKGAKFKLTRVSDYALATWARETIKATKSSKGALARAYSQELNSALGNIKNSLANAFWGDGSGKIGQITSVSAGVITLSQVTDAANFDVGMDIVANPSLTAAGSMRSGTGTVSAVDRDLGTVTYTGTITSIAASDYLFANGDFGAKMSGIAAWIPATAPTSGDNFFGVDRSVDTKRLAGGRYDFSTLPIDEALIQAAVRLGIEEGVPDYCFMNFLDWANLETTLGSRKVYADVETESGLGFTSLVIRGPKGDIKCIADRNAPRGVAHLLQMNTWCLHSLGDAPEVVQDDGLEMLRQSSADGYEARMAYYANLGCEAPGKNARVLIAT